MRVVNGVAWADVESDEPRIVGVRALSGHRLWLLYADGQERLFDMTPLLASGVFARLADESAFAGVGLSYGAPTWPEAEVDLAPEHLYRESVPVVGTHLVVAG